MVGREDGCVSGGGEAMTPTLRGGGRYARGDGESGDEGGRRRAVAGDGSPVTTPAPGRTAPGRAEGLPRGKALPRQAVRAACAGAKRSVAASVMLGLCAFVGVQRLLAFVALGLGGRVERVEEEGKARATLRQGSRCDGVWGPDDPIRGEQRVSNGLM